MRVNQYNQPIGLSLPFWQPAAQPVPITLKGSFCRLEPLDAAAHHMALFEAHQVVADDQNWTYLPYEKPKTPEEMRAHLQQLVDDGGFVNFAVIDITTDKPVGSIALMRIDCPNGVLEIGHVNFSPLLQRTTIATETFFLLLSCTFDTLGFRRCEWKCDSLNEPSRAAALRLGFEYEGRFRNAIVTKGRNRDTDWFSIIRETWPTVRHAFLSWLDADNFDDEGRQLRRLQDFFPRGVK